mgnify:CR=1 FL=1
MKDENSWINEGGSMADGWPSVIHGAGGGISNGSNEELFDDPQNGFTRA